MPRRDILHWVASHNSAECLKLLDTLRPDIVAVYGTLIIGRKVIASVEKLINIHTGFSPTYRGSDTIFWALHNAEPDFVGVTVHRVDPVVDSGAILARGRPAIEADDNEDRLFAKAVRLGADLLCRAIRREVAGTARPVQQNLEAGREYRSVDRTLAAERRMRKLLKNKLLSEVRPEWSEEF
jgi:methionyl-tRNA formyltransferase